MTFVLGRFEEGSKSVKKNKRLHVYSPVSNTFTHLKLGFSCTEAKLVPLLFLLPFYLKAGVFDVNAKSPSGGSPSWEECNVSQRAALSIYSVLLLLLLHVCSRFYQSSQQNLDRRLDPGLSKPGVSYGSEWRLAGVLLRDNFITCV